MFNKSYRDSSIYKLEEVQKIYRNRHESMCTDANLLYEARKGLQRYIDLSIEHINTIKNTPMELSTEVEKINVETSRFSELEKLMYEKAKSVDVKAGTSAATGVAAGVGVAAFGSKVAMGIAMTFGTASTGTAITYLSGAAATNAALAWLGGGALVAGGGGMAAGSAFLALTGPVGWAIGGASLLGAGLFSNSKNKKIAAEALSEVTKVEAAIRAVNGLRTEMNEIQKSIRRNGTSLTDLTRECQGFGNNYTLMNEDQRYKLGTLVNNTFSASKLLNKGIGDNK